MANALEANAVSVRTITEIRIAISFYTISREFATIRG